MTDYIDAIDSKVSSLFGYALIGTAQFNRGFDRYEYTSQIVNTRFAGKNPEVKHTFRSEIRKV
jgi:hypothetical protein